MVRAWWSYLLEADPALARRYQGMLGRTHAFPPVRNGIKPNTLHVSLHDVVVAIIALLGLRFMLLNA